MEDAHMKTVEEVHNYFGTDPERGLSADQVKKFQEKYGPNGQVLDAVWQSIEKLDCPVAVLLASMLAAIS